MGYTTDFRGSIKVEPPLSAAEVAYLNKFSGTRRMNCTQGPYYVDRGGVAGQGEGSFGMGSNPDVIDHNGPPEGQPGLWCQWVATEDGTAIEWDGGEKFYDSAEWMKYIITHFLGSDPIAKKKLPFITGHTLDGTIEAQGEEATDRWDLHVKDNKVFVATYAVVSEGEHEI